MRRLLFFLLIGVLPHFAFQCGIRHWAKYPSQFQIGVNPSKPELVGDTLAFEIVIDPKDYKLKSGQKFVVEVYTVGNKGALLVETIKLETLNPVERKVAHPVDSDTKISTIDLVCSEYKSNKVVSTSPFLQIAEVKDSRKLK
jgi:hypothetical protein